ncbi:MAG: hypothetical protein ACYDBH_00865 [Acidobacteriaceae bacterium]
MPSRIINPFGESPPPPAKTASKIRIAWLIENIFPYTEYLVALMYFDDLPEIDAKREIFAAAVGTAPAEWNDRKIIAKAASLAAWTKSHEIADRFSLRFDVAIFEAKSPIAAAISVAHLNADFGYFLPDDILIRTTRENIQCLKS